MIRLRPTMTAKPKSGNRQHGKKYDSAVARAKTVAA
jgi:hypothetical protein